MYFHTVKPSSSTHVDGEGSDIMLRRQRSLQSAGTRASLGISSLAPAFGLDSSSGVVSPMKVEDVRPRLDAHTRSLAQSGFKASERS